MATSVKVLKGDKAKLERLQALVTLRAGTKVTQQRILSILIDRAMDRADELAERATKVNFPVDDEAYDRVLSLMEDWGVETSWEDVDHILYGSKPTRRR